MAPSKSKRRSRKARAARRAGDGSSPTPAAGAGTHQSPGPRVAGERVTPKVAPRTPAKGTRRQQREARERQVLAQRAGGRTLGTYGERPKSIFGPVPVSEIAILAGLIAVVIGLINHGGPALVVGAIVCGLGVLESTAREHFSGYRSHATLLAAFPAVIVEVVLAELVGSLAHRSYLLIPVIPVFALSFWALRKLFAQARHARVARPPLS